MRILVATWDSAGGFPPERTLIQGLVSRGHDVHVAAHQALQSRIEAMGARFERLPNITEYDSRTPIAPDEERGMIINQIVFSEAFGHDVHAAARRVQPDVQLVDLFLLSSVVAARAAGAPLGLLTTTIFKFIEQFGGLYGAQHEALRAIGEPLGYAPPATLLDLIGDAPVIASTYRPFEIPTTFPPGYLCAGPLREAVAVEDPPFTRASPDKPLVLVSLSTSFMDQAATLQTLCEALGRLDVEAIVTTGGAIDPGSLQAGPNTRVIRYMSHDGILPAARLVVTHAGHGTAMAAVSYGVPLLLLPMGRDQPMIAARAMELGLGAVIDRHASAEAFAAAIATELADPKKLSRSRAFRAALRGHAGIEEAISAVESLTA